MTQHCGTAVKRMCQRCARGIEVHLATCTEALETTFQHAVPGARWTKSNSGILEAEVVLCGADAAPQCLILSRRDITRRRALASTRQSSCAVPSVAFGTPQVAVPLGQAVLL